MWRSGLVRSGLPEAVLHGAKRKLDTGILKETKRLPLIQKNFVVQADKTPDG